MGRALYEAPDGATWATVVPLQKCLAAGREDNHIHSTHNSTSAPKSLKTPGSMAAMSLLSSILFSTRKQGQRSAWHQTKTFTEELPPDRESAKVAVHPLMLRVFAISETPDLQGTLSRQPLSLWVDMKKLADHTDVSGVDRSILLRAQIYW